MSIAQALIPEKQEIEALSDQTAFGSSEPLFEKSTLPTPPPVSAAQQAPSAARKKTHPLLLIGISGMMLVFLFIGVMLLFPKQRARLQKSIQSGSLTLPRAVSPALQKDVDQIKADLTSADPTKLDLPYPPISTKIYVDDPKQ